jgi:hypothetical protein
LLQTTVGVALVGRGVALGGVATCVNDKDKMGCSLRGKGNAAQVVEVLREEETRPRPGVDGVAARTNGWTHEQMRCYHRLAAVLQGSKKRLFRPRSLELPTKFWVASS